MTQNFRLVCRLLLSSPPLLSSSSLLLSSSSPLSPSLLPALPRLYLSISGLSARAAERKTTFFKPAVEAESLAPGAGFTPACFSSCGRGARPRFPVSFCLSFSSFSGISSLLCLETDESRERKLKRGAAGWKTKTKA
ncbi:unnamed protein product [Pleuronectes platessa]|uniref:Uncharacterized protein n=1 Tax=Pleuronectes platessa TaxID=8262 RepID=A0A9N7TQ85_PLEPL|nr:unnamed protein product [Pleuronectes platessa]